MEDTVTTLWIYNWEFVFEDEYDVRRYKKFMQKYTKYVICKTFRLARTLEYFNDIEPLNSEHVDMNYVKWIEDNY